MTDLSILIPARNEIFLSRTIQDILENKRADTEIIAVLDGAWVEPGIPQHERVQVIYHPESIGQRAATNEAARISTARYVMKIDAHCAFAPGFDEVMLADMQDDWTMVPVMRNLHAFDWVCNVCGERTYQGPKRCGKCASEDVVMDVVWRAKPSPNSTAYRFDNTMHFQYWGEYKARQKGDLVETMSLQGSCWMMTREQYHRLNVCDEEFGSWGQQGVEVAVKTWLSGGRVICNKRTWYAHMFRTQNGFSFPYPLSGNQVAHARARSRELFIENKWEGAVRPFSWLIEHFAPVPDWEIPGGLSKGILYYTDNRLDPQIMEACQKNLRAAAGSKRLVSVSIDPLDFGDNIAIRLAPGYLTMFQQILMGLEELETDIVFFAEHDVLYHPTHFDFVPERDDIIYYNQNCWKVRADDGHALYYDCSQTSGLCAYRELLLRHYRERVKRTQEKLDELGDTRAYRNWIRRQGFEPGTHGRAERVDDLQSAAWRSAYPNIDIRHNGNLTPSRWRQAQFRNRRSCRNWQEAESVPGWGTTKGRFGEIINTWLISQLA